MDTFIKAVYSTPQGYFSLWNAKALYIRGQETAAECWLAAHEPPADKCMCGLYAVRTNSLRGIVELRRAGGFPPGRGKAILAVVPVGRAYDDGDIVRAQRLLVLGEVEDWRSVLPEPLQGLEREELEVLLDILVQTSCWGQPLRNTLKRLL